MMSIEAERAENRDKALEAAQAALQAAGVPIRHELWENQLARARGHDYLEAKKLAGMVLSHYLMEYTDWAAEATSTYLEGLL